MQGSKGSNVAMISQLIIHITTAIFLIGTGIYFILLSKGYVNLGNMDKQKAEFLRQNFFGFLKVFGYIIIVGGLAMLVIIIW